MKKLIVICLFLLMSSVGAGDDFYISTASHQWEINWPKPPQAFAFFGDEDQEVGRLSWDGGAVKFKGDMDESAKVFFEYMFKKYADQYCEDKKRNNEKP